MSNWTRHDPRFANLRDGGNLPPERPSLLWLIMGSIFALAVSIGLAHAVVTFAGHVAHYQLETCGVC